MERQLVIYQRSDGKAPYENWLHTLKDKAARAKIRIRVDRVQLGNFGHCKSVGRGVFELKIDFGSGYRVYFGQAGSKMVVLLCGGDKSTQDADIKKAYEYWEDWKRRSHEIA